MGTVGIVAFNTVGVIDLLFCVFLVIAGVIAWVKTKSLISLIASCFFALVFLLSGFLLLIAFQIVGFVMGIIGAVLLGGIMFYRYYKTKAKWPALVITIVTACVLFVTILGFIFWATL
jgi:uncharacterized membrane protein (UPF0136 family)